MPVADTSVPTGTQTQAASLASSPVADTDSEDASSASADVPAAQSADVPVPVAEPATETDPTPAASAPLGVVPPPSVASSVSDIGSKFAANAARWRDLLAEAVLHRKAKKQANLAKVLALAAKKGHVCVEDVRNALRVSESTAEGYLAELMKEGKLHAVGPAHSPKLRYLPVVS